MRRQFGTIKQLKSGRYKARYTRKQKDFYLPTTATYEESAHLLDIVYREILSHDWTPTRVYEVDASPHEPVITFRQAGENIIKYLEKQGASPNTLRTYISTLNGHLYPVIGSKDITLIDTDDMEQIRQFVDNGKRQEHTINLVLERFRTLMNHAVTLGYIENNPIKIQQNRYISKRPTPRGIALTREELTSLIDAIPEPLQLAFIGLSWCALRYSELAPLTERDIISDPYRVRINKSVKRTPTGALVCQPTTKNIFSRREIVFPQRYYPTIEKHLKEYTHRNGQLFYDKDNPYHFYSDRKLRTLLHRTLAGLGLPPMRLHDLRHTGLTLYGQAGATLADLKYRAGHSDIASVIRYQHSSLDRDMQLANLM